MLKNILNLEGAQELSNNEQKDIVAGKPIWCGYCNCGNGELVYVCGGNSSYACFLACNS